VAGQDAPRFIGELLCDWIDETALNALAEQLEVNPPVETQVTMGQEGRATSTVKVLPTGVGLESSTELKQTATRAHTFHSVSPELRLRLVLERLLADDRLHDPITEKLFVIHFEHVRNFDPTSESDLFKRDHALDHPRRDLRDVTSELRATREWAIFEGDWTVRTQASRTWLTLVAIPLTARFAVPVPEEGFLIEAWMWTAPGSQPNASRSLDARGRLRPGERIHATIFGVVDGRSEPGERLWVQSIAVFDRKSGSEDFNWVDHGKKLRKRVEQPGRSLFNRLIGR
jgi:hypothetical protein